MENLVEENTVKTEDMVEDIREVEGPMPEWEYESDGIQDVEWDTDDIIDEHLGYGGWPQCEHIEVTEN